MQHYSSTCCTLSTGTVCCLLWAGEAPVFADLFTGLVFDLESLHLEGAMMTGWVGPQGVTTFSTSLDFTGEALHVPVATLLDCTGLDVTRWGFLFRESLYAFFVLFNVKQLLPTFGEGCLARLESISLSFTVILSIKCVPTFARSTVALLTFLWAKLGFFNGLQVSVLSMYDNLWSLRDLLHVELFVAVFSFAVCRESGVCLSEPDDDILALRKLCLEAGRGVGGIASSSVSECCWFGDGVSFVTFSGSLQLFSGVSLVNGELIFLWSLRRCFGRIGGTVFLWKKNVNNVSTTLQSQQLHW